MSREVALSVRSIAPAARVLGASLLAFTLCAVPGDAKAQSWRDPSETRSYDEQYPPADDTSAAAYADHVGWGARLGLGLTAEPTTFLVDLGLPYTIGDGVSVGARLQLGLSDDDNFVAPTLFLEYAHDLSKQIDGPIGRFRPLLHAGLGFGWLEEDGRTGSNTDTEFLIDIGVGVEYPLNDRFALASTIDFNIMPKELLDESLIFTWQALQLRVNF